MYVWGVSSTRLAILRNGPGAAQWAERLRGHSIDLDDAQFEMLTEACRYHTSGRTEGEISVQTCWDAGRLRRTQC